MIVAAVAAMIGSAAAATAPCSRPTTPQAQGADVYDLQMRLTTTTGVADTLVRTAAGTICARTPGSSSTNIYRKATTLTVEGRIYQCTNLCTTVYKNSALIAWETSQKVPFTAPTITWQEDFPHVMGAKNTDAEAYFKFTGVIAPPAYAYNTQAFFNIQELWCAGQGKFDCTAKRFTSLAGNCAGKGTAPFDVSRTAKACDPSKILLCTQISTCLEDPTTPSNTAIYGTWSIRYNTVSSKTFYNTGALTVPVYFDLSNTAFIGTVQ